MSINWKELGWWLMAAVCILHVYGSAYRIINDHHSERPAIAQQ
jgi:hypothetical protein